MYWGWGCRLEGLWGFRGLGWVTGTVKGTKVSVTLQVWPTEPFAVSTSVRSDGHEVQGPLNPKP